jgi:hypothetical protein
MERSALPGVIVVDAVDVFGVVGSVEVVVTFAVLLSEPSGAEPDTLTTIVNVAVALDARLAFVHVTVPAAPTLGFAQMNAGPVFCASETNVVLAGNVSVNETLVAGDGPLFVTAML